MHSEIGRPQVLRRESAVLAVVRGEGDRDRGGRQLGGVRQDDGGVRPEGRRGRKRGSKTGEENESSGC